MKKIILLYLALMAASVAAPAFGKPETLEAMRIEHIQKLNEEIERLKNDIDLWKRMLSIYGEKYYDAWYAEYGRKYAESSVRLGKLERERVLLLLGR